SAVAEPVRPAMDPPLNSPGSLKPSKEARRDLIPLQGASSALNPNSRSFYTPGADHGGYNPLPTNRSQGFNQIRVGATQPISERNMPPSLLTLNIGHQA